MRIVSGAKFRIDSKVRAVKGPGGSMDAEPFNIGKVGVVMDIHYMRGDRCHYYTVGFEGGVVDVADESSLERAC